MAKEEIYYTLLLTQSSAILSLVEIKEFEPKIVRKSHLYFSDFQELENQLKDLLKKEKETKKLILFLTHHYLDIKTNALKTEYKEVFTRVFKNTGLEPIGYIETYEAIVNYLSKKQEFPLNALIAEIEKTSVSLTLSKGGKTQKTLAQPLTDELEQNLLELLNNFSEKPLPAKIYLLNFCEEREEDVEKLEKVKWPKDLFLHHPEIKILSQEKINHNLIKVFSQELNKEQRKVEEKKETEQSLPLGFAQSEDELKKEEKELPINIPSFSLPSFSFKLPKIPVNLKPPSLSKLIPLIFILLALPALAFSHEIFFHKATVVVYPKTKEIKVTKSIAFDKESPLFYLAKESFEIKKTYKATGEKNVGKKATGTLKFYNFSTKELILTPKTKITYKGKTYYPKEKITVPPATEETSGDSIIKKPGTKTGKVEAEEIGEKYNLSTSDKLSIAGLDTDLYFAKIEGKIAGGTSETVQTVTKSDLQKAREDAKKEALNRLDLTKMQLDPENYIPLENLATTSITEENFDKELGDITDSFTLNAKVEVEVPFLNKEEVIKEFKDEILSQTGTNYTFDPKKFEIQAEVKEGKKQKTTIDISLFGKAFQKVNELALKSYLKGKPVGGVNASLPSSIAKIEIAKNSAFLPFFSSRLPYKIENIEVQLEY